MNELSRETSVYEQIKLGRLIMNDVSRDTSDYERSILDKSNVCTKEAVQTHFERHNS